jgi:precorrin-6B methylase 2
MRVQPDEVRAWLERLYVAAEGATLRREELKKATEVSALLEEVARAVRRRDVVLVDAAAGKAYVGLLAAQLVLADGPGEARVVAIEREAECARILREAASRLDAPRVRVEVAVGDVADATLWPREPTVAVALHACGPASDAVIESAVAAGALRLLLVPCCTGRAVVAAARADAAAEALGFPRHAAVRRAFVESWVAAWRTLRLEAAGYQTEVVPLVPRSVTPENLLWRATRVREPRRMAEARAQLERLEHASVVRSLR